jgi:APA family basic amino acid/polyamine antiporter
LRTLALRVALGFLIAFCFLLVCLSLLRLKKEKGGRLYGQNLLPAAGVVICLYLMFSTSPLDILVGAFVIALGVPIYVYFSPKVSLASLKEQFVQEEAVVARAVERKSRFLANFVRGLRWLLGSRK